MEPKDLARAAAQVLENKKALDLRVLEVADLTVMADFFIIATGTSATHLRTLAEETEFQLKEHAAAQRGA